MVGLATIYPALVVAECPKSNWWGFPRDGAFEACAEGSSAAPSVDCEPASLECESDCGLSNFSTGEGPIGDFRVDSQDRIIYWSGPWRLTALTSDADYAWGFQWCPTVPVASRGLTSGVMPGLGIDFDDILYFFVEDRFYAVRSSDGEVLIERKISLELDTDDSRLLLSTGKFASNSGPRGPKESWDGLLLTSEGELLVPAMEDIFARGQRFHLHKFTRSGHLLDSIYFDSTPNDDPAGFDLTPQYWSRVRLARVAHDRIFVSGRRALDTEPAAAGSGLDIQGEFLVLNDDLKILRAGAIPTDVVAPFSPYEDFEKKGDWIISPVAVASDGAVVGGTWHGQIVRILPNTGEVQVIWDAPTRHPFIFKNGPVLDGDTLTVATDGFFYGYPHLWSFDLPTLIDTREQGFDRPPGTQFEDIRGVNWFYNEERLGDSYSTPTVGEDNTLFFALNGGVALDTETRQEIWKLGDRSGMATSPAILSDGKVVFGEGISGTVMVVDPPQPAVLKETSWPTAGHDQYRSRDATHPFRWDRSEPRPYPTLEEVMAEDPYFQPEPAEGDQDLVDAGMSSDFGDPGPDLGARAQSTTGKISGGCGQTTTRNGSLPEGLLVLLLLICVTSVRPR